MYMYSVLVLDVSMILVVFHCDKLIANTSSVHVFHCLLCCTYLYIHVTVICWYKIAVVLKFDFKN